MSYSAKSIGLLLLALSAIGCSKPHFEKVNGQWAWVDINPARGRRVIPLDADADSFEVLADDRYARDRKQVFFEDRPILDADPGSFEILPDRFEQSGRLFAKDAQHVFLNGQTIVGADPQSYQVIRGPFGKDSDQFFNGTVPLAGVDPDSFTVLRGTMRLTAQHHQEEFVLNYGDEFQGFEVSPDRPALLSGSVWWKDSQHYFYDIHRIEDVDPDSFQVLTDFSAVDKNHEYQFGFRKEEFERRQAEYRKQHQPAAVQ